MTNLGIAIQRLQAAELDLARELRETGERQADEPDILHLTKKLAKKAEEHAERLRPFADRYEAAREGEAEAGEPVRIRQPTGLLLLDELRRLSCPRRTSTSAG